MSTPPVCTCGTFAVGICVDCHKPVCGEHSKMVHGRRLCKEHQRAAAADQAIDPLIFREGSPLKALIDAQCARHGRVLAAILAGGGRIRDRHHYAVVLYYSGVFIAVDERGFDDDGWAEMRWFEKSELQ